MGVRVGWGLGWDGVGWDGVGWDGVGWDGVGWDGVGWDGVGWDGGGGMAKRDMLQCGITIYVFSKIYLSLSNALNQFHATVEFKTKCC